MTKLLLIMRGLLLYVGSFPNDFDEPLPLTNDHVYQSQAAMPFSIIGSTQDVATHDGRSVKGRQYLWGVAEGTFGPSLVFSLKFPLPPHLMPIFCQQISRERGAL